MSEPSFFSRIALALRVLFSGALAQRLVTPPPALEAPSKKEKAADEEKPQAPEPKAPTLIEAAPDSALQLLGLFQREGRFVDFLMEDVSGFSDEEIGAAARIVHEGCAKIAKTHLVISSIRSEEEGAKITLNEIDPSQIRLTGSVGGAPPFTGRLQHRGWRCAEIKLPKLTPDHDASVLAQAELEL